MAARALRARHRLGRDRQLRRLARSDDPSVAAVGRALAAAVRAPDQAEAEWIARIEGLREELGRSGRVIRSPRATWKDVAADDERLRESPVARLALQLSKPARWGRVLLNLTRALRPARALELGTCVGLSTAYQAAGLELAGGGGRITTLEADPRRVELALENLTRLELAGCVDAYPGRFQEALGPALERIEGLGFAFVDGNHRRKATLDYFARIAARLERGGVILFDDIRWSRGMERAWAEIAADPRVALAVDLHGLGACVLGQPATARSLRIRMHP